MNKTLLTLALAVGLLGAPALMQPSDAEPKPAEWKSIPRAWLSATVRIKVWTNNNRDSWYGGAGVAIGPDLVLTCRHLYPGGRSDELGEVEIKHPKHKARSWHSAKILASNHDRDWCLLRVDGRFDSWMPLDYEPLLNLGDPVVAIGSPAGVDANIATLGYIAGFATDPSEDPFLWLASNAIYYGNSGGPMIDPNTGHVIGIVVQARSGGGGLAPNVALFVPLAWIRKDLEKAIEKARTFEMGRVGR